MTNLAYLIENTLSAMEKAEDSHLPLTPSDLTAIVSKDINLPDSGITVDQCLDICQYVYWTYLFSLRDKIRNEIREEMDSTSYWDNYDWCYECMGYGDDYSYDSEGNLVNNCVTCPHNKANWEE